MTAEQASLGNTRPGLGSERPDATFVRLYEEYYDHVYSYCLRRTNRANTEDAAAEVFTIAWRKHSDMPQGEKALSWLYGVAYRVMSHHWRSTRRFANLVGRISEEGSEVPSASRSPGIRPIGFLFLAVVATTLVIVAACAGNGEVTSEDMIGTWRKSGLDFRQFSEDGSYRIALAAESMENSTVDQGQFTLEGTLFSLISNADSAVCDEGQRGSYELEVLEDGPLGEERLHLTLVEDECSRRGSEGDVTLARLS